MNGRLAAGTVAVLFALLGSGISALEAKTIDVGTLGAKGDGVTDDTAAIQRAMDEASAAGGGIVSVPTGNYLIASNLTIPEFVTLEGVWRIPTAWSEHHGTTLLAVANPGQPDATPFITLMRNATLKGVTVFYPEQTETNPPVAYPWTIASGGADNCSIIDVLLVNSYQAVDFGTRVAGRHLVRNLYGQALYRGIFVDQCYDVGRIENVHLWPFWKPTENSPLTSFTREQGVAFIFGRTDWEFVSNSFAIFYNVGFRFTKFSSGPGNVLVTQSGSDIGPTAVLVEDCQGHAGLSFTNGQFYGDIIVQPTNTGPVKFTGCGLFGSTDGGRGVTHAKIAGTGQVSFSNCHFIKLDPRNQGSQMIYADGGRLSLIGCEFMDANLDHVVLDPGVISAVILGNRFGGRMRITNHSAARVEIANNIDDRPEEEAGAIVVDNTADPPSFTTSGEWNRVTAPGNYLGDALWGQRGAGKSVATWTPDLPSAGAYEVSVWYGPDPNDDHATDAPVTVIHAEGTSRFEVNLKENHSRWRPLGRFRFRAGREGRVVIDNSADGNVLADAVKFVPVSQE